METLSSLSQSIESSVEINKPNFAVELARSMFNEIKFASEPELVHGRYPITSPEGALLARAQHLSSLAAQKLRHVQGN